MPQLSLVHINTALSSPTIKSSGDGNATENNYLHSPTFRMTVRSRWQCQALQVSVATCSSLTAQFRSKLTDLTKKDVVFKFTAEHEEAVKSLKHLLKQAMVYIVDWERDFF